MLRPSLTCAPKAMRGRSCVLVKFAKVRFWPQLVKTAVCFCSVFLPITVSLLLGGIGMTYRQCCVIFLIKSSPHCISFSLSKQDSLLIRCLF